MANDGEKVKTVADFIFLDSRITVDSDHSHRLKDACWLEEKLWRTSIQFSHSVVSDSATRWTAACQASLSITKPGACSNSYPLSRWCHPTISSSVVPFSSLPSVFPSIRVFQMSQHFSSGGQSIGISASASVLPMNIQDWFPLGGTGWISLQSKGFSRVFSNTTIEKHQFLNPWLIHVNVWQKPPQYCKVISLQLIKINEKKKKKNTKASILRRLAFFIV